MSGEVAHPMTSPYVVRRPVANTYLVRRRDRRLRRELLGVLVAVVLVGGGLLAYTWVHIEILRTAYRVDGLERELHRLEATERRREYEAAHLGSLEHVAQRARAELDLELATLEQTVFYEELGR